MEQTNTDLISYCGFYCGACPKYTKGHCEGCKGDSPSASAEQLLRSRKCAVGYKACRVRPCCMENGYSSCADCNKFDSVKDCNLYNPFMIRFGQFITQTNRRLGIEMIKEKGETEFVKYMMDKNWVTMKTGNQ